MENRRDLDIITQTITQPATTFVTLVTLGTSPPVTSAPSAPSAGPDIYGHNHGLSSAEVGAILGSVVGVAVLIIAGCICFISRRRRARLDHKSYRSYEAAYLVDESYWPRRPAKVKVSESVMREPVQSSYRTTPAWSTYNIRHSS